MTDNQEHAIVPGCGRQLRRTRERLGLSLDDIASELRLSGHQIQALEEDDWDQLPGATYARGYLRSYGRLLGLDVDQLLAGASTQEIELSRTEPEIEARTSPEPGTGTNEAPRQPSGHFPWAWTTVVVVVAVLATGYWQYREGGLMPDPAGLSGDAAVAVHDESDASASGAGDAAETAWLDEGEGADEPRMPTEPGKAVFQFNDRSWADVRDAGGERLLYRSFPRGRRVEIQGQPPFRVFLGNARAVRVEYMGDVVTPAATSGRLYVRFVLGAPSG